MHQKEKKKSRFKQVNEYCFGYDGDIFISEPIMNRRHFSLMFIHPIKTIKWHLIMDPVA